MIKKISAATCESRSQIIELIDLISDQFIPSIKARVGVEGYYRYLLGENREYLEKKYGCYIDPPHQAEILTARTKQNNVVGVIGYFKHFQPFNGAYIVAILVHPTKQNNGVGTKLFKCALNKLRKYGVNKISVTTWSTNEASKKIFVRYGFRLTKTVKNERAMGIHGLYYKLKIN